jgi:hypothetical protein
MKKKIKEKKRKEKSERKKGEKQEGYEAGWIKWILNEVYWRMPRCC